MISPSVRVVAQVAVQAICNVRGFGTSVPFGCLVAFEDLLLLHVRKSVHGGI